MCWTHYGIALKVAVLKVKLSVILGIIYEVQKAAITTGGEGFEIPKQCQHF